MSKEVEKQKQSVMPRTVKSWLASDYLREQIRLVIPKHCTAERMVRVALTALMKTPKLSDCTPESVMKCLLDLSALGLEPDGRRAHLIPYGNTCTLIVDYKGLVELARNNGEVSSIRADVVCDKDVFTYTNGEVNHGIDFKSDRGPMYAAYVVVTFKDGSKHSEVMTIREIDAIRKRSKASGNGPWVTDYNEMAKKTVFRRASKWISLSPDVQDALERDADSTTPNISLVDELAPPVIDVPQQQAAEVEVVIDKPQADKAASTSGKLTPQDELAAVVTGAGHSFDSFCKWADGTGNVKDATSLTAWSEVPIAVASRILKAKTGLIRGLDEAGKNQSDRIMGVTP